MSAAETTSFEVSPEMLESMLATEAGRSLIVQGLVDQTGLGVEDAECLLETLGADVLASAALSFMAADADGFSAEQTEAIRDAAETCAVPPEVLLGG